LHAISKVPKLLEQTTYLQNGSLGGGQEVIIINCAVIDSEKAVP
jgi:hypothetical protein